MPGGESNRRIDPKYRHVRKATKGAVLGYKQHSLVVTDFLKAHGLDTVGWEIWDVAPFHVLNIRKGNPVPVNILHALDSAIRGREEVTNQFTEANLNPKLTYDGSDITHRVFIEKLRTLRRVWFPKAPEPANTVPASAATRALVSSLASVDLSATDGAASTFGPFNALSGAVAGSSFCKVSFELSVVSGGSARKFAVDAGHVKLTTIGPGKNPFGARESKNLRSEQTAANVAAAVTDRLRGLSKKRKRDRNDDASNKKRKLTDGRAALPSKAGSKRKRQEEEPEYIQISSDPESDSDDEASTRDLHSTRQESQRITGEDAATLPVRRSPRLRKQWIVEIGRTDDMTFYNPSGASPSTYIDETSGMYKLQSLLNQNKPLVLNITLGGRLREFSREELQKTAIHDLDSVSDLRTELVR